MYNRSPILIHFLSNCLSSSAITSRHYSSHPNTAPLGCPTATLRADERVQVSISKSVLDCFLWSVEIDQQRLWIFQFLTACIVSKQILLVLGQCLSSESLPIVDSYDTSNNEIMRSPMMSSSFAKEFDGQIRLIWNKRSKAFASRQNPSFFCLWSRLCSSLILIWVVAVKLAQTTNLYFNDCFSNAECTLRSSPTCPTTRPLG